MSEIPFSEINDKEFKNLLYPTNTPTTIKFRLKKATCYSARKNAWETSRKQCQSKKVFFFTTQCASWLLTTICIKIEEIFAIMKQQKTVQQEARSNKKAYKNAFQQHQYESSQSIHLIRELSERLTYDHPQAVLNIGVPIRVVYDSCKINQVSRGKM